MSDINDELKDLFKAIDEQKPEPELPLAHDIYEKYITASKHPIGLRAQLLIGLSPIFVAIIIIVSITLIMSRADNNDGAKMKYNGGDNDVPSNPIASASLSAEPSRIPTYSGSSSEVLTPEPSVYYSDEQLKSYYVEIYDAVLSTLETNNKASNMSSKLTDYGYKEVTDYSKFDTVIAYISFAKSICQNDNFPISESSVKVDCNYEDNNTIYQQNSMYFNFSFREDNFDFEIYSENAINNKNGDNNFYLSLSINYLIKSHNLCGYSMYLGEFIDGSIKTITRNMYQDNELYEADFNDTEIEKNISDSYYEKYSETYGNLADFDSVGDYSNEYKDTIDNELGKNEFLK